MGNNYSKPIHFIKWSEGEHTMLQNFVSVRCQAMRVTTTKKRLKEITKNYHFTQLGMLAVPVKMKSDGNITPASMSFGLQ